MVRPSHPFSILQLQKILLFFFLAHCLIETHAQFTPQNLDSFKDLARSELKKQLVNGSGDQQSAYLSLKKIVQAG
jgi:hypothetical protein